VGGAEYVEIMRKPVDFLCRFFFTECFLSFWCQWVGRRWWSTSLSWRWRRRGLWRRVVRCDGWLSPRRQRPSSSFDVVVATVRYAVQPDRWPQAAAFAADLRHAGVSGTAWRRQQAVGYRLGRRPGLSRRWPGRRRRQRTCFVNVIQQSTGRPHRADRGVVGRRRRRSPACRAGRLQVPQPRPGLVPARPGRSERLLSGVRRGALPTATDVVVRAGVERAGRPKRRRRRRHHLPIA